MKKRTKFLLLRISVVMVFAILAGRVWYIQVVMGDYYRQQGDTSKMRQVPVQALRGILYDRNGHQLVYNAPEWTIQIVPHGIPSSSATSIYARLASLLHNHPSAAGIAGQVQQNAWQPYKPFTLTRHSPSVVATIPTATAMIIKQLHAQLSGINAVAVSVRQYITGWDNTFSLSHIMGYAGQISPKLYATEKALYPLEHMGPSDQAGRAGIELKMDPYLHGVNGSEEVEVDAGERPIRAVRRAYTIPGDNVYLTIDWKLQQQVARDLQAGLTQLGNRQGIAVVEDVRTGAILSMVSLPSYNNNWFSGTISEKRFASLNNDPATPLNDLATQGQFPPGSTYKVITAAAALQTGAVDINSTVDDTGVINLPGQKYFGWKPGGLGTVNIIGALGMSSDIYFYTVSGGNPTVSPDPPHTGPLPIAQYAKLFGLGRASGIELPFEAPGNIPTATDYGQNWHIGDTYNMAIGQGYNLATPLQMANVAATIANGGTLLRPRLIDRIVGRVTPRVGISNSPHVVQPFVPEIVRSHFISPSNLQLIQEGMHASVNPNPNLGTSNLVADSRVDAAGKTGTAESGIGKPPHAWWIGYAPYNNPQVAVCVMIPYANSEGATAAAPIAHKIFEDYFHLPPSKPNWLSDVTHYLNLGGTE